MDQQQLNSPNKKMGITMIVAMWVLIFVMLGWFFSGVLERQNNPNSSVATQYMTDGLKEVELQRNRYGHYVVSGEVNHHPVVFMLDTGATGVVLPQSLAMRLSLKQGRPIRVQTANGSINAFAVKLDRVSIGDIALNNVNAIVNPADQSDEVLLGMSFLKHIEFTQRGDTLILRQ